MSETTQPDTDAPPTCQVRPTGQEWREPCGRPMPCSAHSDAPQEGRGFVKAAPGVWVNAPQEGRPTAEPRHTEGQGEVCDPSCPHWAWAESRASEGRPTTPQTEAPLLWLMRQMLNRGIADESNRDTLAAIFDEAKARYPEAAAGALPSVDGALLAQYWFEDWSGERFSNLEDQRLWLERGSRVAARLAAAPPEASER
jgi:hypothetical protein